MAEYMDHSLINPNQCRAFGAIVQDNPYCNKKLMSIHDPESSLSIPLHMKGSTAFINTRAPSIDKIQSSNRKIIIGEQYPWNPHVVQQHYNEKIMTCHLIPISKFQCRPSPIPLITESLHLSLQYMWTQALFRRYNLICIC